MSSKELLAILCLLGALSDSSKTEFLSCLNRLQGNEEISVPAASSCLKDLQEVQ